MSKKQFKSQASSGRIGSGFGGLGGSGFGSGQSSILSYVQEPTDLSTISDPNVVVAIKNLTKKDGTTKAKALEDLQAHTSVPDNEIEDGLLEAWARLFPRLAVADNTRRVRQLAHSLNGQICSRCGKRTVKHMPRIAGPWLAGSFDTDRAAARAAADALNLVFNTAEKVVGVKKTFQHSILEYSRDAVLHETVSSLSDERTVSVDDAKSTHARVVATALWTVRLLINDLPIEDRAKEAELYEEIFRDPKLWAFIHDSDASVRRSVARLVQACLETQAELISGDLKTVSKTFVYQGLHSEQTSSALEFLQALIPLTEQHPTIWTEDYTGKRPAASRLRHFLKQGSQGAASQFWETLAKLFRSIPGGVLPKEESEGTELLAGLRSGVCKKEERFNTSVAWPAYYTLADLLVSTMPEDSGRRIIGAHVLPVITQYVDPTSETADFNIPAGKASSVVARASKVTYMDGLLEAEWPSQADRLIELAKMSQPEQAKDFDKSQKQVAGNGERFADLQRGIWTASPCLDEVFMACSGKLIMDCIAILESRNGKPYGAAAIIECLMRASSQRLLENQELRRSYLAFAKERLPSLTFGPSAWQLIHALYPLHNQSDFTALLNGLFDHIVEADEPIEAKRKVIEVAFNPSTPIEASAAARANSRFQGFIAKEVAANASSDSATLFANLAKCGAVSEHTIEQTLSGLTEALTVRDAQQANLTALDGLWATDASLVKRFMASSAPAAGQLVPNVLRLEQSADDTIADKATVLSAKLSSANEGSGTSRNKYGVIIQSLENTSETSLSMDSVSDLLDRLLGGRREVDANVELLPSLDVWRTALLATLRSPRPSLAILSPLGGVAKLIGDHAQGGPQYDSEGLSQALRISMYITKLLHDTDIATQLQDRAASVYAFLYLAVVLADDSLSISGTNGLWRVNDQDTEQAILDFVGDANRALAHYFKDLTPSLSGDSSGGYGKFTSALHGLKPEDDASSPAAYYAGLSSAKAHDSLCEMHGTSAEQSKQAETVVRERRSAKDVVGLAAAIAGFRQALAGSQVLSRYCNELVADLTDLDVDADTQKGFEQLILLNVIHSSQEDGLSVVAKQRRIFLVKRLLSWLATSPTLATQAEICKALSAMFEGIGDMYGEHWEQTIAFLIRYWSVSAYNPTATDEDGITMMNASLRLLATLRKLSKAEEPNDDLVDILNEKQDEIRDALVHVLMAASDANDEHHQPLQLTHELLARQLVTLPSKPIKNADEMFSLLYAPSRAVMQATFNLLHAQVPAAQEQISFDAALDNKTAQLPDELLSLLLEAPTLDSLADASFHRMMPLALQSYLYSWRLLFDHFQGSSYKVKNDYIEQLKDGSYLTSLLDLVFDFLGHTRGRPVDASKFDVQEYTPNVEPSPEKDVQWLLVHLFFLAVTHLPSLVKSYYLDIRSRQTSQSIDTWTAKYISPLVITTSLEAVDEWSKKSVQEDPEYEKMAVKVGMRSREINVSYVVDEQTMAIKVVLPEAYPLASAQVVGVSRVAVKEEKWQSWLRNCQGVITFSNGSITDGLSAWRRNVTGALKGQTECAICYSIISADKQLPTKRCPTCKNLFHSSCLFKWFKSSNASTCPLCRNPFNFNY